MVKNIFQNQLIQLVKCHDIWGKIVRIAGIVIGVDTLLDATSEFLPRECNSAKKTPGIF